MNVTYALIQYVEDPIRKEGRNIGIIAQGFNYLCLRMLGVKPPDIDVTLFEALSPKSRECGWVYLEWIDWFQDLVNDKGMTLDKILAIGRTLEGGNLVIKDGGMIEASDKGILDDAADYLFKRLVSQPKRRITGRFADRIDDILKTAKIYYQGDFEKDISIEFLPVEKASITVTLPIVLMQKPRTVFKVINPRGSVDSLLRQVNDAVYTFDTLVSNGFVDKDHCIAITDKAPAPKAQHINRLADYANIVLLSDLDVVSKVTRVVEKGKIHHH
ncbi:hypothetical protein OR1_01324 [Geobacter sp. OR-1]|uniref:hypothetical protein n=1 Tax=Geobacter sp. OR-1 TaxID=1266765 RepID=UPI0005428AB1|nr:hypothetical protein [Geobacter sp. OR-1]GAM09050.1 hypothetical protein OR1_01324 [Geobacter sp. OR-1]